MKVRAKANIKTDIGWVHAGEVFDTNEDYGDLVEVVMVPAPTTPAKPVPVKEETKPESEKPEEAPKAEPKAEKPKTTRRKKAE